MSEAERPPNGRSFLRSPPQPAIQKLQASANSPPQIATLFPAGVSAEAEFREVDQLTATISRWNHSVVQLGRGAFRGNLALAHTASLQLYRAAWSPSFLVQGDVPPGSLAFGAQVAGAPGAVWRGRELRACDLLLIDSRQEIDLRSKCDCDILTLSVSLDLFAQYADALRGEPLPASAFDTWRLLGRSPIHRRLIGGWMDLLQSALRLGTRLSEPRVAEHLEGEALETLFAHAAPPVREATLAERRQAALRARRYMVLNMEEPLTIKDICLAVRTRERTLHLGFREAFGTTPKRFLKLLRLNAVRRELRQARPHETVTSFACRWGFFHFSNFAADYRRQFGELPSETLRRGGDHVAG